MIAKWGVDSGIVTWLHLTILKSFEIPEFEERQLGKKDL